MIVWVVEITCSSCGRYFDVDDDLATRAKAARCICGTRLRFARETSSGGQQRLGKYQLTRRIAVGGMGEIFYAKIAGIEGFSREVAIKKMLPHLSADRAFIDMMVKEAKLTVLLNHPNIVQVYDLAREANEYYIAMEYVAGTNIGHMLELCYTGNTRLPPDVAVYITMQVLRGLAYAHDLRDPTGEPMHILHRDITPQNILVTQQGWVKITDFGIAKARNEISTTSPGMIKGKLGYIAPEQLAGRAADNRVDLFCAGILLWESLATRRLFKGQDEVDTFRLIAEARVPPMTSIRSDVSPAIEKVIIKSLARDPDERYLNGDDFYNALVAAIYPATVEDLQRSAKAYFKEHPEFFAGVVSASERAANGSDAEELVQAEPELPLVTDFLTRPRGMALPVKPIKRWPIALGVSLAILVIAGVFAGPMIAGRFNVDARAPTVVTAPVLTPPRTDPPDNRQTPLTTTEVELAARGESSRLRECYCGARAKDRPAALLARIAIASTGGVISIALTPSAEKLGGMGICIDGVLTSMLLRPTTTPVFEANVELPSPKSATCAAPVEPRTDTRPAAGNAALTGGEIQAVVQRASSQIAACLQNFEEKKAPDKVDAQLTIDTSGKVSDVSFAPIITEPTVGRCLEKTLRGLKFHKHPVNDFKATIPLRIQQALSRG
ncbi:MAG: serine/threonine protein kinase [Clostridia bacterium]|nr:serine/threonine protein kinase [Deltaproteobacteria bacterium]